MQKSVILHFSEALTDKPVISHLIKSYDLMLNIIQAYITPETAGHLFGILEGSEAALEKAIDDLRDLGVRCILPTRNLVWNEENCVHCGACVGHCRAGALALDPGSANLRFDAERCIGCELCIPACGYQALESISDHLKREGEL